MEYGELITKFRKESGLTIDELSEKSGVPKGTINKIIGGVTKAPTLPNIKAIARAMGKTLADFDDCPAPQTKKAPSLEDGDEELLCEYHSLYPEDQLKVIGYISGLKEHEKYRAKEKTSNAG